MGTEILSICRKEQACFIGSGTLSPRRQAPTTHDEESTPWKHQYFQPRRPPGNATPSGAKPTSLPPLGLPKLRAFFDATGKTDARPEDLPGLVLLETVASERDATVTWRQETELERNIRQRVEQLEETQRSRTEHARQLMLEQIPPKSEREKFLEDYRASKLHYMHAGDSDAARLASYERQAAEEERQRTRRENERKQAGDLRKQQQRELMEQRRKDRETKLQQLLEDEEDVRDTLDAVRKVRLRLEEEASSGTVTRAAVDDA